MWCNG